MKNKVFERELELCWVESWQRVPGPEQRGGTVWVKHAELSGWQLLPHLRVCSCWLCEQQRGWPSRVDLINEQSWLPACLPLWWESASQVKHGEYICSHGGHCNTICWCRLAWLWSGGTWEMWTLAQAGAGIIQRSPGAYWGKAVALPQPPLPAACRADCFERGGWRWWLAAGSRADRRCKRKWEPRWERQFFGGRVCFNAGLSCTAVLAHCCWQHWSLERCLTLPIVPFRALPYLLCAGEHSPFLLAALPPWQEQPPGSFCCPRSLRQSVLSCQPCSSWASPAPPEPAFLLVSLASQMHPALGSHPQ